MTKQAEGAAERPARGRGRRPADEVRADVFRVVGEVLLEEGIADLTFERVARLSGVSKTTLYKWWPSKGALALDGYFHAVEETLAFEDTGDIRADLTRQLRAFAHIMSSSWLRCTRCPGLRSTAGGGTRVSRRRTAVPALDRPALSVVAATLDG
ncbi:TetR/AcrR family transcriptional regulator [Streptomyces massasporeus]|uniref:TetR/AcrR family transcriptional regulator n=1 Tax=Streptomyces massasporeus TaxID=67324 RepID=A0ABW6LK50_9ACTN